MNYPTLTCLLFWRSTLLGALIGALLLVGSAAAIFPGKLTYAQDPVSNVTKRLSTSNKSTESDITFGRIDAIGNKCIMVYGHRSFGGEDFLIEDCGGAEWRKRAEFSVGYINRMFFQSAESGWIVVGGQLASVKVGKNEFDLTVLGKILEKRINDVVFIDEKVGWLCGDDGSIYKTDDGGASWRRKESGTDIDLKEIRFLNAQEGWVSGREYRNQKVVSITLVTRDGGTSWASLNESTGLILSPVSFTSLRHGCGINEVNAIMCTNDGNRWQVVLSDRTRRNTKNAIFFLDEKRAWAVGDNIWHTADGGQTWKQQLTQPSRPSFAFEQVVFVNDKLGWAQSTKHIWRSSDGGQTWTKISDAWIAHLQSKGRLPKLMGRKISQFRRW